MRLRAIAIAAAAVAVCSLPVAVQGQTWHFIVTGDSRSRSADVNNGVNVPVLTEIATAIIAEAPEFVLFGGDLVYGSGDPATLQSQLTTWRDTMQVVYDAGIMVYPVRGNHDDGSDPPWHNVFTGPYALPANGPAGEVNFTYSFSHQNAFIVGLDVYGSHYHRVNQTWLDQQFAVNTLPHVFVMAHAPAFEVYHDDCLNDYPTERDAFWDSIGAEGGRTYFCGHDHLIDHARAQDSNGNWIHQFILGTAGAPFAYWLGYREPGLEGIYNSMGAYGYMVVQIEGLNVTMTIKERQWDGIPGDFVATDVFTYGVSVPADLDADSDVDGFDFLTFSNCFNGSARLPRSGCENLAADLDDDSDVDGFDFLTFSNCFNGSAKPPRCP